MRSVFTIIASDYHPRCALDATDGEEIRVAKIAAMIGYCDWGIHDAGREVELPFNTLNCYQKPHVRANI